MPMRTDFEICRLYRPWVVKLFDAFPQRKHQIFSRIASQGYAIQDFEITPVPTPWLHVSYALGILRSLLRLRSAKPDIIVAEETESALLGILARRLFGIPFVFDFVDDYSLIVKFNNQRIRYQLAKWVERIAPRVADRVIVADTKKLEFCLGLGLPRRKIVLIPNGYDPNLFKPAEKDREMAESLDIREGKKVASFVGKLNRYYNLETIIRGIPEVLSKDADVVFLFVGEGDNSQELEALAVRLGLSGCVRFTGALPHNEIPAVINLSDVCLFPLPDESALILYEYMGCAKPVIVPDGATGKMAISKDVFPDDCMVRVEDSPTGFARGILHLLSHPDMAKAMGLNAQQRVAPLYAWDRLSEKYVQTICEVLNRSD
jgi:glycosyltransferase involved in cell wall biosynthesis